MLLFGIDLETTGLDPDKDEITEIGFAMFDTEYWQIINTYGYLVQIRQKLDSRITEITGLTDKILFEHGYPFEHVVKHLRYFMDKADYLVGHNGINFDSIMLTENVKRAGLESLPEKPWIDTKIDLPFPPTIRSRSLVTLCAEHGFLNPFPHRALFDVAAMFKLLSMYDFDEIMSIVSTPLVWVRAKVSFENKDKAKDAYFRWDSVNKFWVKHLRESILKNEAGSYGFAIEILSSEYKFKEPFTRRL